MPVILLNFKERLLVKRWLLLAPFKDLSAQFELLSYVFQKGKWSFSQNGVFHVQFYPSPHQGSRTQQGLQKLVMALRGQEGCLTTSPSLQICTCSPPGAEMVDTGLHSQGRGCWLVIPPRIEPWLLEKRGPARLQIC